MGILKNKKEVNKLSTTITPKFLIDFFRKSISLIPSESPIPRIGPINGEISIAPITTAVELVFKPVDATRIEKIKTQAFCPFMSTPALIVALSRRNKSINTIAGVAIATALMPPLCTAGYGLATAKWDFFRGALFLFSINTIFIASATFLVVRFLKFPYEEYANSQRRKRISQVISILALAILVPSVYMFYQLYKKSDFNQKADGLISKLRTDKGILILDVHKDFDKKEISFAVVGKSISQSDIQQFKSQMKTFGYESCNFKVLQDAGNLETISKINEIENSFLSNQQLIVKKSQELLDKDKEIFELKNQLQQKSEKQFPFNEIAEEIKALHDDVESVAYSEKITTDFSKTDTIPTFGIFWKNNINSKVKTEENKKLQNWLRKKFKDERIIVVN